MEVEGARKIKRLGRRVKNEKWEHLFACKRVLMQTTHLVKAFHASPEAHPASKSAAKHNKQQGNMLPEAPCDSIKVLAHLPDSERFASARLPATHNILVPFLS